MKGRILVAATALAIAGPLLVAAAQADDPSENTQPGFVPDTGQINPGHAAQPWSAAPPLPQSQQPAQEDARRADDAGQWRPVCWARRAARPRRRTTEQRSTK